MPLAFLSKRMIIQDTVEYKLTFPTYSLMSQQDWQGPDFSFSRILNCIKSFYNKNLFWKFSYFL